MNNPNYEKLIKKLNELFMLDQADLDFGIYRVMNFRRREIQQFIEQDLLSQVRAELDLSGGVDRKATQQKLEAAIKQAHELGADPEALPKVKELRAQLTQSGNAEAMENDVFSHLFSFFNRYYEAGDFVALRRYKEGVYAIPYEGEEVKLHWANADQYYIKSSEYFKNYRFALSDEKVVTFTLQEASTEQNNNKSVGNTERRFKLVENDPLSISDNILTIFFNYEPVEKSVKQDDLTKTALERLEKLVPPAFYELLTKRPTEKNKNRTLLEKHLRDYTARNSFDYFIHKDLGKFLSRELDFFIKNELLVIDDIDTKGDAVQHMTAQFAKIVAVKRIAQKIIAFLAQLEDFQRSLWLKKKFVTETHYCLTLDRIPEIFYTDIAANAAQVQEWIDLFKIDKIGVIARDEATQGGLFPKTAFSKTLSIQFLKENPFLVLDTKHFSADFKMRLLAELPDLDQNTEGVLLHSDNFQALNFLQERYKEQVKCVYIDPPYNTGNDGFTYKDTFQRASWLTFIENRASISKGLLEQSGLNFISIDDNESKNLRNIGETIFGEDSFVAQIIIQSNKRGQTYKEISKTHEYLFLFSKTNNYILNELEKEGEGLAFSDKMGKYDLWELRNRNPKFGKFNRPNLYYSIYVSPNTKDSDGFNRVSPKKSDVYTIEVTPQNSEGKDSCWRWQESTLIENIVGDVPNIVAKQKKDGGWNIYQKSRKSTTKAKTIWDDNTVISEQGTIELGNLDLANDFAHPKPLGILDKILRISTDSDEIALDYFAGSGTTGHAVINLNREDGGKRKYILVEQGEYFDTVLLPRLKKVVYAKDWKNGAPLSTDTGVSHCIKYVRLESYEDTLNNLSLARTEGQELALGESATFRESYYINYLFEAESRHALWNVAQFENPFDVRLHLLRQNEAREQVIDVVETFNYLLGLVVSKTWQADGFRVVEGTTLKDERILIVWSNCLEKSSYDLNGFFELLFFKVRDSEYHKIYVNGNHTLLNTLDETSAPKVVQIEGAFRKLMFENG